MFDAAARSVLTAVKEQVLLSSKTVSGVALTDQKAPSGHVWTPQQWWEALNFLFGCAPPKASGPPARQLDDDHLDDLLFFVHVTGGHHPPFIVRRRQQSLPPELQISGQLFRQVDWCASLLLNLVLQSRFRLTAVACSQNALAAVADGRPPPADRPSCRVARPVFASPSRTSVNLDSSRSSAANPEASYPDICFAVDNFEDAFSEMVLRGPEDCYCIVLHAVLDTASAPTAPAPPPPPLGRRSGPPSSSTAAAAAAPAAPPAASRKPSIHGVEQPRSAPISIPRRSAAPGAAAPLAAPADRQEDLGGSRPAAAAAQPQPAPPPPLLTLFSAYADHSQITQFWVARRRKDRPSLRLPHSGGAERDRIVMTGPAGLGRAEVAVTCAGKDPAAAAGVAAAGREGRSSSGGGGLLSVLGRGIGAVASAVGRTLMPVDSDEEDEAEAAAAARVGASVPLLQLQCSLISLSLPVGVLAQAVLNAL